MKRIIALCSTLCLGLFILLTSCGSKEELPNIEGFLDTTIFKTAITVKPTFVDSDDHDLYYDRVKSYVIVSTMGEEAKEVSRKDVTVTKPSGDNITKNLSATALDFTSLTADTDYSIKLVISSKGTQKTLVTKEIKTLSTGESEEDPILVDSLDMLLGMNKTKDAYYKLTKDIDCGGSISSIFNSSSYFTGTFDGDGHKIYNFKMESNQYTGLFGYMTGATVKNLVLEDVSYDSTRSNTYLGALAGYAKRCVFENVTIRNVNFSHSGQTSSYSYVGGFVGQAINCTIKDCSIQNLDFKAPLVRLKMYIGGFVGENKNSSIENCSVDGKMDAIVSYTSNKEGCLYLGGFSGVNDSNLGITKSYAKVDISISESSTTLSSSGKETFRLCAGGFNGGNINDASRFENCASIGEFTVNIPNAYFVYLGGFAGYTDNQNISTFNTCVYAPTGNGLVVTLEKKPEQTDSDDEEKEEPKVKQTAFVSLGVGKIGDKSGSTVHTIVYEEKMTIENEHENLTQTPYVISKDLDLFTEEIRNLILML